jgi:hypothetical protein
LHSLTDGFQSTLISLGFRVWGLDLAQPHGRVPIDPHQFRSHPQLRLAPFRNKIARAGPPRGVVGSALWYRGGQRYASAPERHHVDRHTEYAERGSEENEEREDDGELADPLKQGSSNAHQVMSVFPRAKKGKGRWRSTGERHQQAPRQIQFNSIQLPASAW